MTTQTQQTSITAETLQGTVASIRFQGEDGWSVAELDSGETIVGTMPGLRVGLDVEVRGEWTEHPDYGRQLEIDHYEQHIPTSTDGIAGWLAAHVDGIGDTKARRLADDVTDPDTKEPTAEAIRDSSAISDMLVERAAKRWSEDAQRRSTLVALQGAGLTSLQAKKAHDKWSARASSIVETNPYRLRELPQIGFKTADGIARGMGIEPDADIRMRAGLEWALEEAQDDGHVGLPADTLISRAADALEVASRKVRPHLDWMLHEAERLTSCHGLIFRPRDDEDEQTVAERLTAIDAKRLSDDESDHPIDERLERHPSLTDQQADVLEAIFTRGGLVTLTGGPGTGKTYTLEAVVDEWRRTDQDLHLGAPTGRAAKRIEEIVGEEAQTIHRLLDYHPHFGFRRQRHNEKNASDEFTSTLDGLIVIDETSMLDTWLASRLFERIADGATLLLVGDPDQLPSVGPGYVLQDVLDSSIGYSAHLTQVHRQAQGSGIVEVAYRINDGKKPDLRRGQVGDDLGLVPVDSSRHAAAAVEASVERLDEKGFDLTEDVQVLAPMHNSAAGVEALNNLLQTVAHGGARPDGGRECGSAYFAEGDRVMQTTNNYDLGVYNGDVGTIVNLGDGLSATREEKSAYGDESPNIVARVRYPSVGKIGYTAYLAASELTLAYACTIHKSQGSQYPATIVVLTASHWIMCERTLLYTAVTRAARFGILIAEERALDRACSHHTPVDRYRALDARLDALNDPEDEEIAT